jgi:Glycine zipper
MNKTWRTRVLLGLVVLTAGGVSLSAQWGRQPRNGRASLAMSGTYELETTRGDDVQRSAELATRNLSQPQRDRAYRRLLSRLEPPTTLAIDREGQTVTISSSSGPRATFDADGRTRNELGPNGRATITRAGFVGDRLSVSTTGNRSTDFLVTFEPVDNGNGLLVTRRFDSEDLRRPVTVQSYYRRVDNQPRWDLYAPERDDAPRWGRGPVTVPDGTRIVAVLDTSLSTRTSRSGERFSMTVQSPEEYQGARIDGVIARITPYGRGRNADMRVDFDTIDLGNGQTAAFEAVLDTVRTPDGMTFRVDGSGGVPDPDRTEATIRQGAVGAALGAIIGAFAGGGKGAAIGAVVGGAGGAILAQDRDEYLNLPPGTQVTIIVRSPRDRRP